jgi:hypothetical protein
LDVQLLKQASMLMNVLDAIKGNTAQDIPLSSGVHKGTHRSLDVPVECKVSSKFLYDSF